MNKFFWCLILIPSLAFAKTTPKKPAEGGPPPDNRVASFFVSQDFINAQLAAHSKAEIVKDLKVTLDSEHGIIFLRGRLQVPTEELRAINLDPKLGAFRFQVSIKPETNKDGYLILEFPLSETYFYPAGSKDIVHDRVIVPVQMLSLALASIRGYLAALSGDFSGFDRRTQKIKALIKGLNLLIAREKNPDALDDLKNQRASLHLQLEAVPIERKQLQSLSKEVTHIMGFTGEKELNLNDELGARKNALVFKIKLAQLAPYLSGVELGGVRLIHNKNESDPQNYLAIDVNSLLDQPLPPSSGSKSQPVKKAKTSPSMIVRLNQSLFESQVVINAEKQKMGSNIRDLLFQLQDDGLHVTGRWHKFFFSIAFETIVDFVTTDVDKFEVRVRDLSIAGVDVEFLSKFVLEAMEKRFDSAMSGICDFKYVGEESDHSRALEVTVNPRKLVPAFPDLHLVEVDVREREFLLKIGKL